jgi:hypothetical protein
VLTGRAATSPATDAWVAGPAGSWPSQVEQCEDEWSADPIGIAYGIGTLLATIIVVVLQWV